MYRISVVSGSPEFMSCMTSPAAMVLVASAITRMIARGVERRHHLEGAGVEEVADQHRGGIAEGLVRRLAAPAAGGVVHDVVVQEGRGVDEFDERRGRDVGRIRRPGRPGGEHDQEGPEAFAAPADDVVPDLVDERDVARQLAADFGVDRREVAGDEGSYVLELHGFLASPLGTGILAANSAVREMRDRRSRFDPGGSRHYNCRLFSESSQSCTPSLPPGASSTG